MPKLCNTLTNLEHGTLQPYASAQVARYDRLADSMMLTNVGANGLLAGDKSKLTFNYQNRLIFTKQTNGEVTATGRRGEYVIQYQVAF